MKKQQDDFFFAPGAIESQPRTRRSTFKELREWLIVVLIFIAFGLVTAFAGGHL